VITAAFFSSWPHQFPELLRGLEVSVKITGGSLLVGMPLGLLLAVLIKSGGRLARSAALILVEVGRGAPALVLLELAYFGLPQAGLTLTSFVSAVAALGWSTAAYTSEIFRASLESVPAGQHEAAAAVGLGRFDEFRDVILPQSIRIALPPLMSISISVFQATALAFAVALPELMSRAYEQGSISFEYLSVFVLAALLYTAISLPASVAVGVVERRLARHL
jgi:polar amino acid transport system permease protein